MDSPAARNPYPSNTSGTNLVGTNSVPRPAARTMEVRPRTLAPARIMGARPRRLTREETIRIFRKLEPLNFQLRSIGYLLRNSTEELAVIIDDFQKALRNEQPATGITPINLLEVVQPVLRDIATSFQNYTNLFTTCLSQVRREVYLAFGPEAWPRGYAYLGYNRYTAAQYKRSIFEVVDILRLACAKIQSSRHRIAISFSLLRRFRQGLSEKLELELDHEVTEQTATPVQPQLSAISGSASGHQE
ncbi:hypothetical protein ABW21_db0204322 [Orbilia brochopaga]|nr:hypothetical protein ABW21_db0204322 [Drechslerella brochopaga]